MKNIRRILVGDRLGAEVAAGLEEIRPDLEVRVRDRDALSADDLEWAQAWTGFRAPRETGGIVWMHSMGAGVDGFLFPAPPGPGVLLTRSMEDFSSSLREYCLAHALARAQHLRMYMEDQRAHRWNPREPSLLSGTEVLVIGTGRVGSGIAKGFRDLGAQLRGLSRSGSSGQHFVHVSRRSELHEELATARIVILATPLTVETRGMMDQAAFDACRGCAVINIGRGGLVDEAALVRALDKGTVSSAALDVFSIEPLPSGSPLWDHPGVTVTPHVGALSTPGGVVHSFLDVLEALDAGRTPPGVVDVGAGY
ncbi:MAG: D-2-hydroxyacid dehydrogenase [Gemmatimonadales bacterium]